MSELNDLITKLCPNGVQYKKLGEIAVIKKGTQLNKSMLLDDGEYPVLNGGKNYSGYWNEYNFDGDRIAISQGGASAGFVSWTEKPFWAGAHCYVIDSSKESELRYLFHVIKSHELDYMKAQYGAGIPSLSLKTLSQTEIPLPPLPVQSEVVRILDAFTELEAELEAELAGRIKQYEYFRYYLLDEKNLERIDGKPAEMKKLGEIVDILDSKRKPVKRGSRVSGKYPYYGANGVQDYINDYLFDGEFLLVGEDGSVITDKGTPILNWANGKIWVNNHAHVLQEKANEPYMLRYIKYALECKNIARFIHGAIPKLNQQTLKSIEIPVPSLATQERIVDILDRFDTLTTSLTDGIPAEIAMRREQYEYYRSRLLDFPRLPEDSNSDGNVE